MDSRSLVNAISLSRMALGLVLVVTFKPEPMLFWISVGVCLAALATDIADGFLARRLGVASVYGRQWDSLGDKSFYIAVMVAFLENGMLLSVICWGLIVREIALYIMRVLYIEKMPKLELIRPYTNWHGYFMYATIIFGFIHLYMKLGSMEGDVYILIQTTASMALLFGIASIAKFMSLR